MSRRTDRVEAILPTALALVSAVREGPDQVAEVLRRADLEAMCVALAALVPDDRSAADLLGWYDPDADKRRVNAEKARLDRLRRQAAGTLRPRQHGTHSGYNGHRDRREEACEACVLAERIYNRDRKRIRRARQVAA